MPFEKQNQADLAMISKSVGASALKQRCWMSPSTHRLSKGSSAHKNKISRSQCHQPSTQYRWYWEADVQKFWDKEYKQDLGYTCMSCHWSHILILGTCIFICFPTPSHVTYSTHYSNLHIMIFTIYIYKIVWLIYSYHLISNLD